MEEEEEGQEEVSLLVEVQHGTGQVFDEGNIWEFGPLPSSSTSDESVNTTERRNKGILKYSDPDETGVSSASKEQEDQPSPSKKAKHSVSFIAELVSRTRYYHSPQMLINKTKQSKRENKKLCSQGANSTHDPSSSFQTPQSPSFPASIIPSGVLPTVTTTRDSSIPPLLQSKTLNSDDGSAHGINKHSGVQIDPENYLRLCPELVDCQDSIQLIIHKLTPDMVLHMLQNDFNKDGIKTIGDLSSRTPESIQHYLISSPRNETTRNVLKTYYNSKNVAQVKLAESITHVELTLLQENLSKNSNEILIEETKSIESEINTSNIRKIASAELTKLLSLRFSVTIEKLEISQNSTDGKLAPVNKSKPSETEEEQFECSTPTTSAPYFDSKANLNGTKPKTGLRSLRVRASSSPRIREVLNRKPKGIVKGRKRLFEADEVYLEPKSCKRSNLYSSIEQQESEDPLVESSSSAFDFVDNGDPDPLVNNNNGKGKVNNMTATPEIDEPEQQQKLPNSCETLKDISEQSEEVGVTTTTGGGEPEIDSTNTQTIQAAHSALNLDLDNEISQLAKDVLQKEEEEEEKELGMIPIELSPATSQQKQEELEAEVKDPQAKVGIGMTSEIQHIDTLSALGSKTSTAVVIENDDTSDDDDIILVALEPPQPTTEESNEPDSTVEVLEDDLVQVQVKDVVSDFETESTWDSEKNLDLPPASTLGNQATSTSSFAIVEGNNDLHLSSNPKTPTSTRITPEPESDDEEVTISSLPLLSTANIKNSEYARAILSAFPLSINNMKIFGLHLRHSVMQASTINSLSEDLSKLLASGNSSDVTINCDGRDFKLHKAILSARSKVFSAMFKSNVPMDLNSGILTVQDIDADVFQILLEFVYTSKLNLESYTYEQLIGLVKAGDKYKLEELKQLCFHRLGGMMNESNCGELAVLGYLHSASIDDRNMVFEFCSKNWSKLTHDTKFRELALRHTNAFMAPIDG